MADVQGDPASADLVVSGPDTLDRARACRGERIALALRPLGGRFPQAPEGFADYAVEVPGQGDRFAPYAPVDPAAPRWPWPATELTADQSSRAPADAAELGLTPGSRLLTGRAYDSWEGLSTGLLAPLASGVPSSCAATWTTWTRQRWPGASRANGSATRRYDKRGERHPSGPRRAEPPGLSTDGGT